MRHALRLSRRSFLLLGAGSLASVLFGACRRSTLDSPLVGFVAQAEPSVPTRYSDDGLSKELVDLLQSNQTPDTVLLQLMPLVVDILACDRTFLYIRDPQRQRTRITHGHSRDSRWPTMVQAGWSPESPDLNAKDPLTASAYQSPVAKFIEDIETAPPGTLDLAMERAIFGHRALVHAPIYHEGTFYGILEPCVFYGPRVWADADRQLIQGLQSHLGAWIIRYLAHG